MAVVVALVVGQEPLVRSGEEEEGGEGEQAGLVRREVAPLRPPGSVMLRRANTRALFLTT